MDVITINESFQKYLLRGYRIEVARNRAVESAALQVAGSVRAGHGLEPALRACGFGKVRMLASAITNLVEDVKPRDSRQMASIVYVVADAQGYPGIPSVDCIMSHLPKDRKPTAHDVREALRLCRQGSVPRIFS